MRVLVTGAAGFVGGALVEDLLARTGVEVIGVARSSASISSGAKFVKADVSLPGWTRELPENIDVVVSLAQSRRYQEFPDGVRDMMAVNIDANVELLDWSRRANVSKFIFASSGNVYRAESRAFTEDDICETADFYSATKLAAEYLLRPYSAFLQVVTARLFGVYGPGQKIGLFRNLMNAVADGRTVTLAGGFGLKLTPIYVADCARALALLALQDLAQRDTIVNVGGDKETDIREIASLMGRCLEKPVHFSETHQAPRYLTASSDRLYTLIGWRPEVSLSSGISRMAAAGR